MSGTASSATGAGPKIPQQAGRADEPTGWIGWIVFAASLLVMSGCFSIIQGLVGVFQDEYYLVTKNGLAVHADFTTWGWTQMLIGAVQILVAVGLFAGQMWARVTGVILAGASALVNFAFIAAYPFWSLMVIALDVFVILALTVHGREMKNI